MRLAGKTALVTGAGRNIGRAIALQLAADGANVVVNTRSNVEEAATVCREVEGLGRKALSVQADVGEEAGAQRLAEAALKAFGGVDVLVCNAVFRCHEELSGHSTEGWRRSMGVIVDSAFYLTRALVPGMVERKWGRIILISGYGGFGSSGVALGTAKMALTGMCQALARGYAPHNVLANVICPGVMDTQRAPGARTTSANAVPVGHLGSPERLAKLAGLLASDDNDFVTGQTIMINGGQFMALA